MLPLKEIYVIEASLVRTLGGAEKGSGSRPGAASESPCGAGPKEGQRPGLPRHLAPFVEGHIGLSILDQWA